MNYNQGLSIRPSQTSVKFRDIYSTLTSQTSTSSEASGGSGFQPQVPETSNMTQVQEANVSALWQGMTLKKILEEVDLSSMFLDEESKKDQASKNSSNGIVNPESAFLGPKIWSRPAISMPSIAGGQHHGHSEDYSVMNIDDFLEENGFDKNETETDSGSDGAQSPRSSNDMDTKDTTLISKVEEQPEVPFKKMKILEPVKQPAGAKSSNENTTCNNNDHQNPGGNNLFLYAESKRAKMDRAKEEKRLAAARDIEFSPQELALATVPGMNFDPRDCRFSPEELRPQPIIRKRKKTFVPTDAKDGDYWAKRDKNNFAARRSREARRLKENQIALRTAFLEKENHQLKIEFDKVKAENVELQSEKQALINKLKRYEPTPNIM